MNNPRIHWLAGCWDLAESTFTATDGTVTTPWGADPSGVLIVTPAGELSAHGGRRGRAPFAAENPTPAEKQPAYDDYIVLRTPPLALGGKTVVARMLWRRRMAVVERCLQHPGETVVK